MFENINWFDAMIFVMVFHLWMGRIIDNAMPLKGKK